MNLICKCLWDSCFLRFDEPVALAQHVLQHAEQSLDFQCKWEDCCFSLKSTKDYRFFAFKRHVQLHVFILSRAMLDLEFLHQHDIYTNLATCSIKDRLVGYFPSYLACLWKDCLFKTNSIIKLFEHNHCHAEDCVNETCQYSGCSFQTECRKLLLEHIFQHIKLPNFVCPCCFQIFYRQREFLNHVMTNFLISVQKEDISKSKEYHCAWGRCTEKFATYESLHWHLDNCHHKLALQIKHCLWRGCLMPTEFENFIMDDVFVACHLYLHLYVEAKRVASLGRRKSNHGWVCRKTTLLRHSTKAKHTSVLLWNRSILCNGFVCRWNNCDYKTYIAQFFCEHVVTHSHLEEETNLNRKTRISMNESPTTICLWQISNDEGVEVTGRLCNQVLCRQGSLKCHILRHTGLPLYSCVVCGLGFTEIDTFREHLSRLDDSDDKQTNGGQDSTFCCPDCQRHFNTSRNFSSHRRLCRQRCLSLPSSVDDQSSVDGKSSAPDLASSGELKQPQRCRKATSQTKSNTRVPKMFCPLGRSVVLSDSGVCNSIASVNFNQAWVDQPGVSALDTPSLAALLAEKRAKKAQHMRVWRERTSQTSDSLTSTCLRLLADDLPVASDY